MWGFLCCKISSRESTLVFIPLIFRYMTLKLFSSFFIVLPLLVFFPFLFFLLLLSCLLLSVVYFSLPPSSSPSSLPSSSLLFLDPSPFLAPSDDVEPGCFLSLLTLAGTFFGGQHASADFSFVQLHV